MITSIANATRLTAAVLSIAALAACAGPAKAGATPEGTTLVETRPDGSKVFERGNERFVEHAATELDRAALHHTEPLKGDKAVLYVNGLGCPLCATNIDKQLLRLKSVAAATVDLGNGTVEVAFAKGAKPSAHDLSESVADAGFTLVKLRN